MARGDRKVAAVIEEAYKNGALYDSWSEHFQMCIRDRVIDGGAGFAHPGAII